MFAQEGTDGLGVGSILRLGTPTPFEHIPKLGYSARSIFRPHCGWYFVRNLNNNLVVRLQTVG